MRWTKDVLSETQLIDMFRTEYFNLKNNQRVASKKSGLDLTASWNLVKIAQANGFKTMIDSTDKDSGFAYLSKLLPQYQKFVHDFNTEFVRGLAAGIPRAELISNLMKKYSAPLMQYFQLKANSYASWTASFFKDTYPDLDWESLGEEAFQNFMGLRKQKTKKDEQFPDYKSGTHDEVWKPSKSSIVKTMFYFDPNKTYEKGWMKNPSAEEGPSDDSFEDDENIDTTSQYSDEPGWNTFRNNPKEKQEIINQSLPSYADDNTRENLAELDSVIDDIDDSDTQEITEEVKGNGGGVAQMSVINAMEGRLKQCVRNSFKQEFLRRSQLNPYSNVINTGSEEGEDNEDRLDYMADPQSSNQYESIANNDIVIRAYREALRWLQTPPDKRQKPSTTVSAILNYMEQTGDFADLQKELGHGTERAVSRNSNIAIQWVMNKIEETEIGAGIRKNFSDRYKSVFYPESPFATAALQAKSERLKEMGKSFGNTTRLNTRNPEEIAALVQQTSQDVPPLVDAFHYLVDKGVISSPGMFEGNLRGVTIPTKQSMVVGNILCNALFNAFNTMSTFGNEKVNVGGKFQGFGIAEATEEFRKYATEGLESNKELDQIKLVPQIVNKINTTPITDLLATAPFWFRTCFVKLALDRRKLTYNDVSKNPELAKEIGEEVNAQAFGERPGTNWASHFESPEGVAETPNKFKKVYPEKMAPETYPQEIADEAQATGDMLTFKDFWEKLPKDDKSMFGKETNDVYNQIRKFPHTTYVKKRPLDMSGKDINYKGVTPATLKDEEASSSLKKEVFAKSMLRAASVAEKHNKWEYSDFLQNLALRSMK